MLFRSSGTTGHTEAIQVHYDPARVSYDTLLEVFWRQVDPTDSGGQFVDRGSQYRPEIFFHDEVQRDTALASRAALEASGRFASAKAARGHLKRGAEHVIIAAPCADVPQLLAGILNLQFPAD